MNENKYLIIYHKEDNDGLFSMSIIYNYLVHEVKIIESNISLFGADYDDLSNISDEDLNNWKNQFTNIIITDVCFNNTKRMKYLYTEFGNNIIWIDHHAPVIQESFNLKYDNMNGIRDINRSAILNAYKYFYDPLDEKYRNKSLPEILRILSAYDSWSFEKEGYKKDYVISINKAITYEYKLDPNKCINFIYDIIYNNSVAYVDIIKYKILGDNLFEYDKTNYKNLINYYGDFSWTLCDLDGNKRTVCTLFYQGPTGSYVFESVKEKIQNGVIFKRLPSGNWVISLYNTNDNDDFHCGIFCKKKYKGGGHKGAAGCQITEKQFLKLLKTKEI